MEIKVRPSIPPKAAHLFSFEDVYSFDEPEEALDQIKYLIGLGISANVEAYPILGK